MTLKTLKIADLGRVITGKTPPTKQQKFFDGEFPFITPSDLEYDSYVISNTVTTVTDDAKDKFRNQFIPAGAITYTCIASVGKIAIAARESLTNQQINSLIPNANHDGKYLYYLLRNETKKIQGRCSGVATPIINKSDFERVEVDVPELAIQRVIGETLSAYDDLIENNRRRIALLEESARLLYREWFVRLRFPGHEHTRIVNGVPEGWKKVTLGELATKIGSGVTPRGGDASYLTEGIPLIRSMNIYDDRFDSDGLAFISDEQAARMANVTVQSRDILINITGASVARCCMAPERFVPARVNQHVMIIRVDPSKASPCFVHAAINSEERKRQLLSYAQKGSTREALTKEGLSNFEITLPPPELVAHFGEIAECSFLQRETLALQNQKLRTARDLLLPKLMSGEIEV